MRKRASIAGAFVSLVLTAGPAFAIVVQVDRGGVQNVGTVYLANTIISGNTRLLPEQQDCFGTLRSAGAGQVTNPR